jgi:hypothetical protein
MERAKGLQQAGRAILNSKDLKAALTANKSEEFPAAGTRVNVDFGGL